MFKIVSKEDFFKFLDNYKNNLRAGTTTICDPPIHHYHDISLPTNSKVGSCEYFFDTEVARIVMDWMGPNGEIVMGEELYEYKIREGM